jgi:hypothetical protein
MKLLDLFARHSDGVFPSIQGNHGSTARQDFFVPQTTLGST